MAMDHPPLQSPTNRHFFQPLLPGFETHLTIPVAFFSKHIEGKHDQKRARLRSDGSDKAWKVIVDGRRLTGEGWKDFVTAHALRIGDIVIFKHEGEMVFHVTPLGPSCCEIQYTQPHTIKEEDNIDSDYEIQNARRKKKKNSKPEAGSSSLSCNYCFVAKVTDSDLNVDKLHLPFEAARSLALNRRAYFKIILVNEEGNSWTSSLKSCGGCYYLKGGWRSFCRENSYKVGDLITFNLVGDGTTSPLLCICPEEKCVGLKNEYKSKERERRRIRRGVYGYLHRLQRKADLSAKDIKQRLTETDTKAEPQGIKITKQDTAST